MPNHRRNTPDDRRSSRRGTVLAWASAAVLTVTAATLTAGSAVSAFTVAVRNDPNSATTGTLVLVESSDGTSCASTGAGTTTDSGSSTCSTINKYGGGLLVPGGSSTKTVTLTNRGSVAATAATLTAAPCTSARASGATASGSGDLCSALRVDIATTGPGGATVYTGALSGLSGTTALAPVPVAPGASLTVVVSVTFPSTGADNTVQGLTASQPLTWTFSS
ncbi:hypothetical protein ACUN7V_03010 [Quadrisphaera oryzae]|uniref:hypothetical protein n=1 Tax=Quadrisphaera TaxID=317661 RepID=UPI00164492F6|nr:hypothetical protein [Quadrisphaera sp. RL12-1S]MBC3761842.1 hypothetical protein [Quadrisphaera sp. RL12-1S]